MAGVEQRLQLTPTPEQIPLTAVQLVTLVDALGDGTLNGRQRTLLHTLRCGLVALADRDLDMPQTPKTADNP